MVEVLRDALGHLRVTHGMFLDWHSLATLASLDDALPRQDKQPVSLTAMIDDRPASDFAADRIGRILMEGGADWKDDASPEPLTNLPRFADAARFAREVVGELNSLPWRYTFSLRLPHKIGSVLRAMIDATGRRDIGGGLALADERALDGYLPLPEGLNRLALLGGGHGWGSDTVYLQVPLEGYADKYGMSGTARLAVETMQTFIGLGIALRIFRYDPSYTPLGFAQPAIVHHVHRHDAGEGAVHDTAFGLEASMLMGMEGFAFVEYGPAFPMEMLVADVIERMRICFTHPKEATRINRAAQWLATSSMSRNGTMAFVQAMVAVEILLGDKKTTDMVGIGELLSNRLAYLIGTSQADREQVLSDFRGLYAVRSEIVHSGKTRLSHSEWAKYSRLVWMCGTAIKEEIELLRKNSR
ncbi:HEPN domain-containing protein [Methylobacterium sp. E-016]|uniref:HEPN domain-containing protein n=1 Tax=Methylobacterium sp. E-016 TaxID=2836556 RepID=UPI001FBA772B|nr:HEPN domain-containing protein [Methylobacterium sp. E-016]MCJ2079225.1 HEPN domain-containing protein [Methylobacterium sp. E-016]